MKLMKTYQLFILFIIRCTFSSCSKSVYYAWSGPKGDYCTLEVKKYEVIYRASAFYYLLDDNMYIYIKDANYKYSSIDNRSHSPITINFSNLMEIFRITVSESQKEHPAPFVKVITEGFDFFNRNENGRHVFYNRTKSQDTIHLKSLYNIEYDEKKDFSDITDPFLQKEGIRYFPNEMVRVKNKLQRVFCIYSKNRA